MRLDTEKVGVQGPEYLVEHLGADRRRAYGACGDGQPEVVLGAR